MHIRTGRSSVLVRDVSDLPVAREQRARLDRLDTDPEILTAMCARMAKEGISLYEAAHDAGFSLTRFRRWMQDPEHPERQADWDFARQVFGDHLGVETVRIADEQAEVVKKDGTKYDPDVARDTLRVNARFKVADPVQ